MTRQEKIEQERKRQERLQLTEDYNRFGRTRKTYGVQTIDPGETLRTGKTIYKKPDVIENKGGRVGVGNIESIRKRTGNESNNAGGMGDSTYKDGSTFKQTKGSRDNMSKEEKRRESRLLAKEARKNRRARKLADNKGMSDQQAKDFMQNRRDRFRQKGTNFVKGLTGQAMDTGVDDRLYRRDGSGTLQNMKTEDGTTYDATAPYKGTMSKGFTDRGGSRNEADNYIKSLNPKKDDKLESKLIEIPKYVAPEPKKVIQDETEETNEKIVEGNKPLEKMDEYTFAGNVTPNRIVKDKIRTRAKGNFYDSAQTIDGFPDTPKATKFNIDVDKVDRKGLQDVITEEKLKQLGLDSNFNKLPKKFNSQDILYNPNAG